MPSVVCGLHRNTTDDSLFSLHLEEFGVQAVKTLFTQKLLSMISDLLFQHFYIRRKWPDNTNIFFSAVVQLEQACFCGR